MIYGYCRISTAGQNIERQVRNILSAYPDAIIIREIYTRTKMNRKEWNKLFKNVREGDRIVFDSVSRMSGNVEDGFQAYEDLFRRGVELEFLKEHHIDTETYKKALQNNVELTGGTVDFILEGVNRYLLELAKEQIRLAFMQSEKEVSDLHQRTKEGMETARLNGKQIGRVKGKKYDTKKSISTKEIIRKYARDFGGSLNDADTMKIAGIARNTYYKYKKEIMEEQGTE